MNVPAPLPARGQCGRARSRAASPPRPASPLPSRSRGTPPCPHPGRALREAGWGCCAGGCWRRDGSPGGVQKSRWWKARAAGGEAVAQKQGRRQRRCLSGAALSAVPDSYTLFKVCFLHTEEVLGKPTREAARGGS
ncbi:hypothetical protein Y1Q_0021363 [Alligator mississippiensis]|uniref:Uncharacterized protein n=1 Tax=Alligator mississippiensis TaxID=8496 RepID=A0A151P9P1_ALLMI|nr:hypothetical protein Y1Q_0021363 [Alligator mississippiensis]